LPAIDKDRTPARRRRRAALQRNAASLALCAVSALAASCGRGNVRPITAAPPPPPRVSVDAAAHAIPERVKDRRGWATAVIAALDALGMTPAREPVCAVLAIIEQESGFVANPTVANLARIVDAKLDELAKKLGPLGHPAIDRLLEGKAPGYSESFATRLKKVKTEQDLDVVFRDLVAYYRAKFPTATATAEIAGALFTGEEVDDLNPVTTAGSMQVSVRFAAALGAQRGLTREQVRDALYTREGGVEYGTARLFAYQAGYPRLLYRFADYNAGMFASRNAALQEQLALLVGIALVPDGDILAYDRAGRVLDVDTQSLAALIAFRAAFAPELSEREVRADARHEKQLEFESTETYRAVKRVFQERQGTTPAYARLPDVTLKSPKLARTRTTAWFAESVDRRFQACLARLPAAGGDKSL
jgi:Protein of unknown function (DUF1615)